MEKKEWMKLKSGTDIRGTALDSEGKKVNLTPEVAEKIGCGFASWLRDKKEIEGTLEIAVGHDSRLSAEQLKEGLISGLSASGVKVYDCGLAFTPAMFMSTVLPEHVYDGAVMITASHLPSDKNGFKFFTREGGLEAENIVELLEIAAEEKYEAAEADTGEVTELDFMADYAGYIVDKIRDGVRADDSIKPLSDFHIIVDAGNGSGAIFVERILKPLGADTGGSLYLDPDGRFPNHAPNPEDKGALEAIKKAVKEEGADLGIIFDTDVDRAAVVDSEGNAVNRNRLVALASAIVLEDNPGATIVTDSVTSRGLTSFIEDKLDGVHHRYRRGYKNVINEAWKLNDEGVDAPLAIETSGHAAFRENYFLDDGAYLVAKILVKIADLWAGGESRIKDLIADLEEPDIAEEFRMEIQLTDFREYGKSILSDLKDFVAAYPDWSIASPNYEGVRVNCGGMAWFLMRMSLHDPVLVLNVECDGEKEFEEILELLNDFMVQYEDVEQGVLVS